MMMIMRLTPDTNRFAPPQAQHTALAGVGHNTPTQRNGSIRITEAAVGKIANHIDADALQRMEQHAEKLEIDATRRYLDNPKMLHKIEGFKPLKLPPALLDVANTLEYNAKRMFGLPSRKEPLDVKTNYEFGRMVGDFKEDDAPKRTVEIGIAHDIYGGDGYHIKAQVLDHPSVSHEQASQLNSLLGLPAPRKIEKIDMVNKQLSNQLESSIKKNLQYNFGLEHGNDFLITPASLPKPVQG